MIYKAIVIDNSHFFERGTIIVRIANFYFGKMTFDLIKDGGKDSINSSKIKGNDLKTLDWEAKVAAPIGGGRNYGALFIPQVNETGIVTFLNGNQKDCLWLGSLFEIIKDEDLKSIAVNIPSDKLEAEGIDSDGAIEGVSNLDAEDDKEALKKNFILRTKNTTFVDEKEEEIDWQQVHTTNVVSIGEKDILLRHYAEEDGWNENVPEKYQDIKLHRNEDGKDLINLETTNVTDEINSKISIFEDNVLISITNSDGENSISISTDDNGLTITDLNENVFNLNADGLTFTSIKDVNIIGDGDINVNTSGDTIISADGKVILQDDEKGAVRLKELLSIIGAFESHGHICPSGPTVGPPTDGTPAPLAPQLIGDKRGMESSVVGMK